MTPDVGAASGLLTRTLVRIATRGSGVALRRAALVQRALAERGVESEVVPFKTAGDRKEPKPLGSINERSTFTKELESALRRRKVDMAVHALEVLPSDDRDGLTIAAVLPRGEPRDAVVISDQAQAASLDELPAGSRVATSNFRQRALLRALRPDLEAVDLRGDVPTRFRKIDLGRVHAAIIAGESLRLLGAEQRVSAFLPPPQWLPAPGAGITAIQVRAEDATMRAMVADLGDPETMMAARAELAFATALEGGVQVPVAALLARDGEAWILHGLIVRLDGTAIVRGHLSLDERDPALGGVRLANQLRSDGGSDILDSLRSAGAIPAPQPD